MNHRYRICSRCGERWNVPCVGPNPKKYICPACDGRERRKHREPIHMSRMRQSLLLGRKLG